MSVVVVGDGDGGERTRLGCTEGWGALAEECHRQASELLARMVAMLTKLLR